MNKPLTRAEVARETTWDLADLFATRAAWLAALADVERSVASVAQYQGRLATGPAVLLACLDARDDVLAALDRAETFAGLREAEDGGDPDRQADQSTAAALGARVRAALTFVDTEILALPEGTLAAWLRDEPALAAYRPTLDRLAALKPHRLSAETEHVLASLGEVLERAVHGLQPREDRRHDVRAVHRRGRRLAPELVQPLPVDLRGRSADTSVRRAAWASFNAGLAPYQHTMGGTFAIEVAKNIVLAKARGHASAERYLLHEHQVPFELYSNVLDIIQAELAPHMQRYARLRRRVLGLDKLLYCDIKAPLDPGYAPATTFDDTAALLEAALAPLGAEYVALVKNAFERRWIDRADNAGKASGAFCATPYGVHSFILMTWTDSMRDTFTLAHELGHAGHFMLAGQHQRRANTDVAMPFVEAPSIMNEVLLARHILAKLDRHAHAPLGADAGARHLSPQLRHPPARGRAAAPGLPARRSRPAGHRIAAERAQARHPAGLLGRHGRDRRRRGDDLDAPAALLLRPVSVHLLGRPGRRDGAGREVESRGRRRAVAMARRCCAPAARCRRST